MSSRRAQEDQPQKTGEPFVDLRAGLELACKKAGFEGVTWHTLRHTFASCLLERGADIKTVMELLGHSTVIVTMRCTAAPTRISFPRLRRSENSRATVTILLHRAPKRSSRNLKCHKSAANSRITLELEMEEWVSG